MEGKAILLVLVLLAAIPLAAADQNQSVGPVTATTANYDQGSGCGGANGQHTRDARVTTQVDDRNDLRGELSQYCLDDSGSDMNGNSWSSHSNQTTVGVYRDGPGQSNANLVIFTWSTSSYRYDYGGMADSGEGCSSYLVVAGAGFAPGCPTLDGSGAPLVYLP